MTLIVNNLQAGYGTSKVLFDVHLTIPAGKIITLLGRNGMGKTTTVRSIVGMVPERSGQIDFKGKPIISRDSYEIARLGVGLVPEGRRIFPNLSVKENLIATAANRDKRKTPWTVEKIVELFPNLSRRMTNDGWQLSGGEQQMLAIGRALMTNPSLLILDEATEGLAPLIREEIWDCLTQLKAMKLSILLIDKNIERIMDIADHHYILEKGRVVWEGDSHLLKEDITTAQQYLGI